MSVLDFPLSYGQDMYVAAQIVDALSTVLLHHALKNVRVSSLLLTPAAVRGLSRRCLESRVSH
jgi:hypothetical protein